MRRGKEEVFCYGDGIGSPISRPFRFTGFVDDIISLRYTGWFSDQHQIGLVVGVVFQLPAYKGATRYLAGTEWGDSGKRFDPGGGRIDCSAVYTSKQEAARIANRMAEIEAEDARTESEEEEKRTEEFERKCHLDLIDRVAAAIKALPAEHAELVANWDKLLAHRLVSVA